MPSTGMITHANLLCQIIKINVKLIINDNHPLPLSLTKSTAVKNKHNVETAMRTLMLFFKKVITNSGGITTANSAPMVFRFNVGPLGFGIPENKLKA
jgi:hypothetical protein